MYLNSDQQKLHILQKSRDQSGFVTVVVLLLISVVAAISSAIIDRQVSTQRYISNSRLDSDLYYLQQKIIGTIYNQQAWQSQTSTNTCMSNGNACSNIDQSRPLVLKDNKGSIINDSTDATFGYNYRGEICHNFSNTGNDQCPFKYTLSWTPTNCVAGVCMIRIAGSFSYSPSPSSKVIILNPTRRNFTFVRGREERSLQDACVSVGGSFNQTTDRCDMRRTESASCPAGQYVVQLDNIGELECRPVISMTESCPEGTGSIGMTASGELNCKSILNWK